MQLQSSRIDHPAAGPGHGEQRSPSAAGGTRALTPPGPAPLCPGRTRESNAAPSAQSEHARPQGPSAASSARRSPAPSAGAAPALPWRPLGPAALSVPFSAEGGLLRGAAAAGRAAGPAGAVLEVPGCGSEPGCAAQAGSAAVPVPPPVCPEEARGEQCGPGPHPGTDTPPFLEQAFSFPI